jgi:HTH-type transcriptional regulator/antitoxin HigA
MKLVITQEWLRKATHKVDDSMVASGSVADLESLEPNATSALLTFTRRPAAVEMRRRGWLDEFVQDKDTPAAEVVEAIKTLLFGRQAMFANAPMYRGSGQLSLGDWDRPLATKIWLDHVSRVAARTKISKFDPTKLETKDLLDLAHLSRKPRGPSLAKEWLEAKGIYLAVGQQLPSMKLDGAAAMLRTGHPLIALTLRYDRIDGFWFTLFHELGHIKRHLLQDEAAVFLDDLEVADSQDEAEAQANAFARDALIPRDVWRRSEAYRLKTKKAVVHLAEALKIAPAIVAGRLRFETNNYTIFPDLIGEGSVREFFAS